MRLRLWQPYGRGRARATLRANRHGRGGAPRGSEGGSAWRSRSWSWSWSWSRSRSRSRMPAWSPSRSPPTEWSPEPPARTGPPLRVPSSSRSPWHRSRDLRQPLREHSRLVLEHDLDLAEIDDSRHDAVAKLRVANEIALPESRARVVALEVRHRAADCGLLPGLLTILARR